MLRRPWFKKVRLLKWSLRLFWFKISFRVPESPESLDRSCWFCVFFGVLVLIFLLALSLDVSYSAADHTRLLPKRRKTTTLHPFTMNKANTVKRLPRIFLSSVFWSILVALSWSSKCPILGPGVLGSVDCWLFFHVLFLISCLSLSALLSVSCLCPCSLDVAGRICSKQIRSCCALDSVL